MPEILQRLGDRWFRELAGARSSTTESCEPGHPGNRFLARVVAPQRPAGPREEPRCGSTACRNCSPRPPCGAWRPARDRCRPTPPRRPPCPLRRQRHGQHLEAPPRAVHRDEQRQGPRDPDVRRRHPARRRRCSRPTRTARRSTSKVPVIVTITAYNKTVHRRRLRRHPRRRRPDVPGQARLRPAHGRRPRHRHVRGPVERVRRPREQGRRRGHDLGARKQPWSNGNTGDDRAVVHGHRPDVRRRRPAAPASRRSSRRCPAADVYRDVVASGGQIDVGFIPLWLGLVTATGLIPPAVTAHRPAVRHQRARSTTSVGGRHVHRPAAGQGARRRRARRTTARSTAERSPINVVDKVKVPTFFDRRRVRPVPARHSRCCSRTCSKRGVPTKMIIGPWDHLQGSSGGRGRQGRLRHRCNELQLRWFDHYVKGVTDPTLDSDIAAAHLLRAGHRRLARGRAAGSARPSTRSSLRSCPAPSSRRQPPAGSRPARRSRRHVDVLPDPGRRASAPGRPTSGPPA